MGCFQASMRGQLVEKDDLLEEFRTTVDELQTKMEASTDYVSRVS